MDATLKKFNDDKMLRDTVEEYLVNKLKERAIAQLFAGEVEEAFATAAANSVILEAFRDLREMFEPQKTIKNHSSR